MPARLEAKNSPFHNPKWVESVKKIYSLRVVTVKGEHSPTSFLLIERFGKKLVSLPYCDYGGPEKDGVMDFEYLDGEAKDLKVDYIEVRDPGKELEKQLLENGFSAGKEYDCFSIKLGKDKEWFWESLDKKVRNSIRKAEKEGLKVVQSFDLDAFYRIYRKTMKRHGTPHHPKKLFREILQKCRGKIFFAEIEGKKVAVSLFLPSGRGLYYWVNASERSYMHLNPNDLIMHEACLWGIENGFESIELGRSMSDRGTYLFKKKWATDERRMGYFFKFYKKTSMPDEVSKKYTALRSIWTLSPAFMTNFLGPRIRKYFP
ncbi:hypothetical protein A3K63_03945 [Candidatus Micrarchaeota archaeon RBG_16_49_10]|nr:MAG: hypothetical protein A3K63_03945 [Candidatus Micrarchaeota archaeon RBG_16_49_10]